MSFKSDLKVYENPNPQRKQEIKWSEEIMMEKNRKPREETVSPLLQWWLNEQTIK
jgi:hypothetical protein